MVDDLPEDSVIKKDLTFFEENFGGIMPLEIVVDTQKPKGVLDLKNLEKIDAFETFLGDQEVMSKPVSIVSFVKASRQAFYNNNPKRYELPNRRDKNFILRYFRNESEDQKLLESFVDSTGQKLRISLQVADMGSQKMDSLINNVLVPKKDEFFQESTLKATITGTTPIFIKGNKFLIENLQLSFVLAFSIIAVLMALLFMNGRMILLSIIPNVIPLLCTAGIMGYLGIPLKPSTAIVFSIAFGISVDYSIHFLARYRQELFANDFFVPVAVSKALRGIGPSMIYTSIVLLAGFIIFTISDFGGTVALGFLTSITLFISMLTNLIVLPAMLLTFDDGKRKKDVHPLIEQYDEFYQEAEDEEINLEKIEVEGAVSQ
jgi:predicted RND superfamily exporter protein